MANLFKEPEAAAGENKIPALIFWVICLSCILLPAAVIINFNMGNSMFRAEMADHWSGYQAPPPAAADAGSPAAPLESAYNELACRLNAVSVTIAGTRLAGGVSVPAHGSGIVLAGRYVLTNYHIVENALDLNITVCCPAAAVYPAKVIQADKANDIALLEVAAADSLASASLGNSDQVNVGDLIFSMGSASGTDNLFTTGVVAGKGVPFAAGGLQYRDMIQTETYVPQGACGGPLADISGAVIGINTTVYTPPGGGTEVGFATPITRALALLQNANVPGFSGPAAPSVAAAYSV